MKIALRLDAGKDQAGQERKLTMLIDQDGHLHDVLVGWPAASDATIHWGPILMITPEEWLTQLQVAQGVGL